MERNGRRSDGFVTQAVRHPETRELFFSYSFRGVWNEIHMSLSRKCAMLLTPHELFC